MNRTQNLQHLKSHPDGWDVVVIGGGASGLGVALDALSRGLKVALVDKSDFARGTSSRSTKLLHGGVRYLAQGNVRLVLEALRERGRLIRNAPHLTANQAFVIPIYRKREGVKYTMGLTGYDWMAGRKGIGSSKFIGREETLRRLPQIRQEGLRGGVLYHDGQFDDARMAIALAQTCAQLGGCLLNYARVVDLLKDGDGRVTGVRIKDEINKERHPIHAHMVVNATGVFADKILQLDKPGVARSIQPSQGIHLVLDASFLGGKDALMIPKTPDGRVLFAVPWKGKLVVGTTDTLREKPKLEPVALREEIDFVLATAGTFLRRKPTRADVLSVYAGLRPLAAPTIGSTKTKEISRSHKVIVSESGLVTLTGGKWTTYRQMGEDTMNHFTPLTGIPVARGLTKAIKLHGYTTKPDGGHWMVYGTDAARIKALAAAQPELNQPLHPRYPYLLAEVVWAVREEMALSIDDVLSRRIRLLVLDARAAREAAPEVARVMAAELGHGAAWMERQLAAFDKLVLKYLIPTDHDSRT